MKIEDKWILEHGSLSELTIEERNTNPALDGAVFVIEKNPRRSWPGTQYCEVNSLT